MVNLMGCAEHIIMLCLMFQVKHFVADYLLQTECMLGKFSARPTVWIPALGAHAMVHGLFTAVLCGVVANMWWVGLLDLIIHFVVDRAKASPNLLGRFQPAQRAFWVVLGADQAVHHICHYGYVILMIPK